jgi:hypothetical protein
MKMQMPLSIRFIAAVFAVFAALALVSPVVAQSVLEGGPALQPVVASEDEVGVAGAATWVGDVGVPWWEVSTQPGQLQPPEQPAMTVAPRRPAYRLASVPNMFGDFFGNGGSFMFEGNTGTTVDLPAAGGSRRVKIGENNGAIPVDRAYFVYNHFHNALETLVDANDPSTRMQHPIDRYTIGLEKTFACGRWSVDVRMPFTGDNDFLSPLVTVDAGQIGNLAVIVKHLLWHNDCAAVGIGLGIDIPTGSDVRVRMPPPADITLLLENQSVHLLPYIGFVASRDAAFVNFFVQADLAANGNDVSIGPFDAPPLLPAGRFTEQNLLYVDLGGGAWLYRDPCACRFTGLAAIVELHYTAALNDPDFLMAPTQSNSAVTLTSEAGRFNVLNLTAGLHAELGSCSSLRVAGVFPVRDEPDRFFDAEIQVSFNRRF